MGFEVTTAGDGSEALSVVDKRGAFDLLVTDIGLSGGMSGLELARAVQALHPHIKVMTMTGYNDPNAMDFVKQHPDWINLRKPIKKAVLADSLKDLLRPQ
jgi:CheY-like chemotaxis protein